MNKAKRLISLVLCILITLGGWTVSRADLVTVGILLTGITTGEDGSARTEVIDGDFRVYQNGREVGTIAAGRQTLTLNSMERIRIEPVPQSFAPGWDLSTAYLTPELAGSGTQMIPVTVYRKKEQTATPVPEVPTPTPEVAEGSEEPEGIPEATPEAEAEIEVPVVTGPIQTPTLPPYSVTVTSTPEPLLPGIEGTGAGNLRVQVFMDKNQNGIRNENTEPGVRDITVFLLDEEGKALASEATDADGSAVFSDIPEGTYRTEIWLPDGFCFTPYGGEDDLTLSAYGLTGKDSQVSNPVGIRAGTESRQGIGILNKGGTMGGFCWLDETVDGIYSEGEAKIPDVRVELQHQTENITYETRTDADGNWKIGHLYPGKYTLRVTRPDGMMLTRYTRTGGNKRSFLTIETSYRTVEAGTAARTDMNIGFHWATQIYGRCYLDANYNGVYDEGEKPLAGVKLYVRFSYDGEDAAKAVSGADGTYVLTGMRKNQYNIQVFLPDDGSVFTKAAPELPLGNLFAPRGDRRDQMLKSVSLQDAEQREMNIGVIYPGTVSGTVYYDDNFSAKKDENEKTAGNLTVTIRDADGNVAATAKANGAGRYELKGLTPGEYTLDVTAAKGYAFTKAGEGNVILNKTQGQGYSEPFRVELGEKVTGMDIGMIRPGTVKGTVFADRNDNGVRDAGEDGLTGVTVRLMNETEGEAFRTEIGADGGFLFDAVMPGQYYVEYILPEHTIFAKTASGGNTIAGTENIGRTGSFNFATGEIRQAPLCGALKLGRIEGIVYQDHDGNGLKENEETLEGLTLKLIPSRSDLQTVTVFTDGSGKFLLDQLHPDTYQLQVICPEGYVLSRTDYMSLPLKAGEAEQTVNLDVLMGAEWLNQETGAVLPAAIRGQIWMDENNNGLFDEGERMPAGYTVYIMDEATGNIFDTPVTDDEGCFSAAGMIPGSFTVSMPLDERTIAPKPGDSVFSEENGTLILTGIRLQENENREGLLMGVIRYAEISGHAWIDRGGSVESLNGVKITMKDLSGNVIAETETDSTGNYRLQRLMPCSFILEADAPEGCVIIEPGDPRLNDTLLSVIAYPTNRVGTTGTTELKMAQDLEQMDIGCVLPGRLGDFCWVDLNYDGLQAGDEPGIPNVRIELLRDGSPVAETETNEYGFYRFVDLYPASYVLRVTAPAEVKPTRRRTDLPMIASVLEEKDGTEVYSVPVTVESNRNQYNADLGFVCRKEGVLPAGAGEGETQDWIPDY